MKWQGGKKSSNYEDRRGMSTGGKVAIGGIGGIVILLLGFLMGGDPGDLLMQLQQMNSQGIEQAGDHPRELTAEEQKLTDFSLTVLQSTEDVWNQIFRKDFEAQYPPTTLVLYDNATPTDGCGMGQSAFGPFYCPADQKIYLDLTFNKELYQRFGAQGEFALAYVIAHEVGHHIQNQTGVLEQTNSLRSKLSERDNNKVSVMTELQADFYAGVWAHHLNRYSDIEITYDDIVDGMKAAAAVGDDHLQKQAQGYAVPESFTHGTSEQRASWFKKGYDTGDVRSGNTFEDPALQ